MKTIRESMGLVVAAMSIVFLLGVAGWSVYAEFTESREMAPGKLKPAAQEAAKDLERRVEKLELEQKMTENAAREASSSVALIIGEYIWTDRTGRRPLRYRGLDDSGAPMRDEKGRELVAFDAEGPVVVRDFTGSGFLLSSRQVLTSGFVSQSVVRRSFARRIRRA